MEKSQRISFEAVLFGVYVALTPANQILKLGDGSTINKYIGLAVIAVILLKKMTSGEGISFKTLPEILPLFLWFAVSTIWSGNKSETIDSIISLANYILLWLVVSEKTWNEAEKKLIISLSIAMGIYIVYLLIISQLSGTRRSTLTLENSGLYADQNGLGVNLSFLFIMALHMVFRSEKISVKALMMASCFAFVIGVFTTGSRGAFIGLLIGFLFYLNSSRGYLQKAGTVSKILMLLGFGLVIYLIFEKGWIINASTGNRYTDRSLLFDTEGSGRLELWEMYIDILNQTIYPYIIGFGYGTTFSVFTQYKWNWAPGTHNTYLYLLVCSGIVGLILFIFFIVLHLRKCTEKKDLLSKTLIIISMIAMITLDQFMKKDLWNVFSFAQIGLGSLMLTNQENLGNGTEIHHYRYIK